MKETALVTGACGFVGSCVADYLLKKGYRVLATDHPQARRNALPEGIEFIPADLTLPQSLEALRGAEFQKVFHAAAVFDYSASWQKLHQVNCQGTRNLLEFLAPRKNSLKSIVLWSSGSVYGRSFRKEPLKETEKPDPINLYEKSKLLQEQIAFEFYRSEGLPVTVVRPSAIYGPGSRYGLAVPLFLIRWGILRFIPGHGQAVGGFVHVEDVASAAEFLSSKPEVIGEIFNLTDDSTLTMEEAFLYAASLMKVRFWRVHLPLFPIRLLSWADQNACRILRRRPTLEGDLLDYLSRDFWMDNSKLKALGYRFKYKDFRSGLPGTIAWYREKGWM